MFAAMLGSMSILRELVEQLYEMRGTRVLIFVLILSVFSRKPMT